VSTALGNGTTEARDYDRAGRLSGVRSTRGGATLSSFSVTRDAVGNPLQVLDQAGATTSYSYDAADRLTQVCYAPRCGGAGEFIAWSYDAVGNRRTETRPAGTTTSSYDAADQLTATAGLVSATYAYDARGNQTRAGDRSFAYDRTDQLVSTTAAGATTTYAYDGDGTRLRTASPAGTTAESWDPNEALPTLAVQHDGTTTRRYAYGLGAIAETTGAATSYYHHDLVGSVVGLTDAAGAPTATYAYEPFGALRSSSGGAADNPLRFTGEHQDPSGLYYLRARSYDPTTGRFLQTDPVSPALTDPSLSPYAYVANRPTLLTDPSGMCFFCLKTLKSVANQTWHGARFIRTIPSTAVGLAVGEATGGDCHWNGKNAVFICYGAWTPGGADAFTFGSTVNTSFSEKDFRIANNGRLLAHETKHTDQWAIFGNSHFPILYGEEWARSRIQYRGGDPGCHNALERWAGLKDGGYTCNGGHK
jgi:RHS repeat-associated protein